MAIGAIFFMLTNAGKKYSRRKRGEEGNLECTCPYACITWSWKRSKLYTMGMTTRPPPK